MKQGGSGDAAGNGCGRCNWCTALQVLGLGTAASDDEIRSTHRLLAQVWHPDRFQTNQKLRDAAEEKLKEINRAYQFLTSPEGRGARCTGGSPGTAERWADNASAPASTYTEARDPEPRGQSGVPRRARVRLTLHSGKLLRYGAISVCAAVVSVFLWQRLDSYLDSNPDTSKFYGETKARVSANAAEVWGEFRDTVRQDLRLGRPGPAAIAANSTGNEAEKPRGPGGHGVHPSQPAVVKILPYITADLTEQEVEMIQGPPTEATGDKLVYRRSELYFRANHLVGWKIDPASPLRVKLWPDSAVDPDLETFTLGSSKNEVLVVQGTPSLFSDNKFGYGRSEVYFENDRVIGWKSDPTTVPLRVTVR